MVQDGRSLSQVIIKSVAIHIAYFYAFGHLLGLQGHTVRNQKNLIITCIVFPLLPLILLIRDICDALVSRIEDRERTNWEYYLSGALGMQAEPKDPANIEVANEGRGLSKHLLACKPSDGVPTKERIEYDWRWMARTFFWVIFTAQAIMALYLLARRVWSKNFRDDLESVSDILDDHYWTDVQLSKFADSTFDQLDGAAALGGVATGISILGNLLLNVRWQQTAAHRTIEPRESTQDKAFLLPYTVCELLILGRTTWTFLYPTIRRATSTLLGYAYGPTSRFDQSVGVLNIVGYAVIFPLTFIVYLVQGTMTVGNIRSVRYGEDFPFKIKTFFSTMGLVLLLTKALTVISYAAGIWMIKSCMSWALRQSYTCYVPFWFWRDDLTEKLYVL